jgi:hypothetical protein
MAANSLDLSLPEAPRRSGGPVLLWVLLLVALSSLGILIALLAGQRGAGGGAAGTAAATADPERLRTLAQDLERRTLYEQAAEVWGEYARSARLSLEEAAEVIYLRGKCLSRAGRHAQAARFLTETELLKLPQERRREAHRLLLECLSALGKEEVREDVLRKFTVPDEKEKGTVLARLGGEPITSEELREELHREAESLLRLQGVLDRAEAARRARKMVEEKLKDPELRRQALHQLLSMRILYREGLARNLAAGPEFEQAVLQFRRSHLAGLVLQAQVEEMLKGIGTVDLKNHYEAHRDDYVEKPAVEFSWLRLGSEEEGRAAIEKLAAGGAQATDVAGRFEKGGGPAVQGEPIPGLGRSAEATAHLFALDEGKHSDRPIRAGDGWCIFRVESKRPRRQKSFEEARQEVAADLARAKQQEALEKLQRELSEKFRVEVLDVPAEGFAGADEENAGAPQGSAGQAEKGSDGSPAAEGK